MSNTTDVWSHTRELIHRAALPLAQPPFNLARFPENADIALAAFVLFTLTQNVFSPALSKALFPDAYGKANRKTRANWDLHVVSQVHALLVIPLAWRCLNSPKLLADKAFGWDDKSGIVGAVACGYFFWDALESVIHFTDFGFLAHGVSCLFIYMLGFQPFLGYYGCRFLFWEVSTVFLNIHWFLDKTGRTGSLLQAINGALLVAVFFVVRVVWGGMMSYEFFHTLRDVLHQVPVINVIVYGIGNILLQGLNWLWFLKMISALRKRFQSSSKSRIAREKRE